jgi:hypothetical protein
MLSRGCGFLIGWRPSATYNIPIAYAWRASWTSRPGGGAGRCGAPREPAHHFSGRGRASLSVILSAEQVSPALKVEELSEAALGSRLTELAATSIDLSQEISLRAWLLRLESHRHVLLLLLHHIAGDGWSMGPLFGDLAQAYSARRAGEAPVFAELPVQYADYTLWQREFLGEESDPESLLSRQLGFGAPGSARRSQPAGRPCTARGASYRGRRCHCARC